MTCLVVRRQQFFHLAAQIDIVGADFVQVSGHILCRLPFEGVAKDFANIVRCRTHRRVPRFATVDQCSVGAGAAPKIGEYLS
jgi:hypothetical protein